MTLYKKLAKNNLALPPPQPLPGSNKLLSYVILTKDVFPLQEHIMKLFNGHHDKGALIIVKDDDTNIDTDALVEQWTIFLGC